MSRTHLMNRINDRYRRILLAEEGGGGAPASWPTVDGFSQTGSAEFHEVQCRGVRFSGDGLQILVASDSEIKSSVVFAEALVPTDTTSPTNILTATMDDMAWNDDGTKLFCATGSAIQERANAGTPFRPTTGELSVLTDSFSPTAGPDSVELSLDGTKLWYCAGNTLVYEVTMSVAWDLTTAANGNTFTVANTARCVRISPDGVTMYVQTAHLLTEYTLSEPYDITSASTTGRTIADISVGSAGGGIFGFDVSTDGTVLLVQSQWGNNVANNDTMIWTRA